MLEISLFYIAATVALVATILAMTRANAIHALIYLDCLAIGRGGDLLSDRRTLCRGSGNCYLCRCHHGAVCLCDYDAQSRAKRAMPVRSSG